MRQKEAPHENGSIVFMCPGRGPGATAYCPIVEKMKEEDARKEGTVFDEDPDDARKVILRVPDENKRGACCTHRSSFTVPKAEQSRHLQPIQYGSPEWLAVYRHGRSAIEGRNAYLKDESRTGAELAGRRRLRGHTAQFILQRILVAAGNLRLIDKWRDETLNHRDAAARERYFAAKLSKKRRRKKRAWSRADTWDNFAARHAAEKAPGV